MLLVAGVQAAGGALNSAIQAYLSRSQSAQSTAPSGQETLYDEDNWARLLDIQSVLCLVRQYTSEFATLPPSIFAPDNQNANADADAGIPNAPEQRRDFEWHGAESIEQVLDGKRDVDSELINDPKAYLARKTMSLIRSTERLLEVLETAAKGPSGSSPRAWNLCLVEAVEIGLQVFQRYLLIFRRLARAPTGSVMQKIYYQLGFDDTMMLESSMSKFAPVSVGLFRKNYRLRLCSDQRFLTFRSNYLSKAAEVGIDAGGMAMASGSTMGICMAASSLAMPMFLPVGLGLASSAIAKKARSDKMEIVRSGGSDSESFRFVVIRNARQNNLPHLHFGMTVYLWHKTSGYLTASSDKEKAATLMVLHAEDRYRTEGISRTVVLRDRIVLREIDTNKDLGRIKKGKDSWEVAFGHSDDILWTVTADT